MATLVTGARNAGSGAREEPFGNWRWGAGAVGSDSHGKFAQEGRQLDAACPHDRLSVERNMARPLLESANALRSPKSQTRRGADVLRSVLAQRLTSASTAGSHAGSHRGERPLVAFPLTSARRSSDYADQIIADGCGDCPSLAADLPAFVVGGGRPGDLALRRPGHGRGPEYWCARAEARRAQTGTCGHDRCC